jgi:hypothetical protein
MAMVSFEIKPFLARGIFSFGLPNSLIAFSKSLLCETSATGTPAGFTGGWYWGKVGSVIYFTQCCLGALLDGRPRRSCRRNILRLRSKRGRWSTFVWLKRLPDGIEDGAFMFSRRMVIETTKHRQSKP